jgi:hypothetical protein
MSKQQRSIRFFGTLKNLLEAPASHGQAVASGLGRGHGHLWLSSSRVPTVRCFSASHPAQHKAVSVLT